MQENIAPSAWQGGYPNQYAIQDEIDLVFPEYNSGQEVPLVKTFDLGGSAYRFLSVYITDTKWTYLFYDFLNNTVKGVHRSYSRYDDIEDSASAIIKCPSNETYDGTYYYKFVMQNGKLFFYAGNTSGEKRRSLKFMAF